MLSALFVAIAVVAQLFPASAALQARNTIDGMVMTADRRPVVNARVFLQNDSYSELQTVYTDGSGRFTFRGLSSATYNVVVESSDGLLERQSQRVEAQAYNGRATGAGGEVFRVEFVMKPRRNIGKDPAAAGTVPAVVFSQQVPENAKTEYAGALKSFESNDADQGIVSLKQAIAIFPDYYDALDRLGTEYVKRRDFSSASTVLAHAVEINKNNWGSFYYLGVAYLETKQYEEGVKALRRALELNPNSVNANMRLGMILATNKDMHAEAIKSFKKVTELAGKQVPDSYLYLAKLCSEEKQYGEAAESLEAYVKLIPPSESQQRDQYKKVIEQLKQKASEQQKQKAK